MIDHLEYAIEAVKARRSGSYLYGEFLRELEAAGLTSTRIRELLARAEAIVPHPQAERALRILKTAAKAARQGDAERVERLRATARDLLQDDHEFFVIIEEHRLSFAVQAQSPEPAREVRHGFATASFA